jgi:hypothetical protein
MEISLCVTDITLVPISMTNIRRQEIAVSRFTNLDSHRLTYAHLRPFLTLLSRFSRDLVIVMLTDWYYKRGIPC